MDHRLHGLYHVGMAMQVKVQALDFSHDERYLASLGGQDDNALVSSVAEAAAAAAAAAATTCLTSGRWRGILASWQPADPTAKSPSQNRTGDVMSNAESA